MTGTTHTKQDAYTRVFTKPEEDVRNDLKHDMKMEEV
jgi:hypothetical protein